ncbi:uncharacterized protein [Triticum aestivum]|uniref:uncharacterized protein n=1 Tax=Triticum aestivum TaxID=4565 RepID=UPI001D014479|nr:uncharacterized protein LOC123049843 [Triticum aestivum]
MSTLRPRVSDSRRKEWEQCWHRFYKCIRYDSRQCRFFEFQRAYNMRMTHEQILAMQHQAGWHPPGFGFAPQQGNGPSQMVRATIQPQIQAQLQPQMQPQTQPQIQSPMQQLPPAGNNMIADAGVGAAYGAQGLGAVAVLMAAVNIMLTVVLLMVVLAK